MTDHSAERQTAAIVFGGSRGIGAAIARQLADDGFAVAVTYSGHADEAASVRDSIIGNGGRAIAVQADSRDRSAVQEAVAIVARELGQLEVVVINAGVLRLGRIASLALKDFDLLLDVNVRGVFLAMQAAIPALRDGGRIITIGSNGAVRVGSPEGSAYAMTKAAVAKLVEGLALELAPRRITVNNVQPGPIATDMTAAFAHQIVGRIPLQRMGKPSEVASLVSYLASSDAGFMTGASLTIDGGFIL